MSTTVKLVLPIIIINVILVLIAIFDLVKHDKESIRGGNKFIWVPVIVLFSIIGPVIYLVLGKKQ